MGWNKMDPVQFVQDLTNRVTALAWALFILTWSIGWTLRGAPIPFLRIRRTGESLVEDSVWAAFWLAMGTTVFTIITYVVDMVTS